jgi:hypothetical protein
LREKNAQKRVLSRKKRNKVSENSPKTLVFVQVVVLMSKNKLNFHEMNNKKVLQSRPKYVIIHESDMRRSERLPPTGGELSWSMSVHRAEEYAAAHLKRYIPSPFSRKLLIQMLMCEQIRFL